MEAHPLQTELPAAPAAGFSLVELLVVIALIALVVALAIPRGAPAGDLEQLAARVADRVRERRTAARRLQPLAAATIFEAATSPPLEINFADLATTASLRISDSPTDASGQSGTHFDAATNSWQFVYADNALRLDGAWRVVGSVGDLPTSVPPLPGGVLVRGVAFDAAGRAWGDPAGTGGALLAPASLTDQGAEAAFWAVYFTDGARAFAVGVHATGCVEIWRYDASRGWFGFGQRQFARGSVCYELGPRQFAS